MRTLKTPWLASLLFSSVAMVAIVGCDNDGGANIGQKAPGNMDDGVALEQGEIAVAPQGTSFLARINDALIYADVDGSSRTLSGLDDADRLIFSPKRNVVYVVAKNASTLRAHDLDTDKVLWTRSIKIEKDPDFFVENQRPWLHVTNDDRFVAIIGLDDVVLFDAQNGKKKASWRADTTIADFDFALEGSKAYVAAEDDWTDDPSTSFTTLSLPALEPTTIALPNCADEVVLDTRGKFAFMAPTTCNQDPVSVVNLNSGKFVRNLPGFGPVALASEGDVAIAFMDLENLDTDLFLEGDPLPEGDRRYHLMLIDTRTLEFTTMELGDSVPRYATTPDGQLLLIDAAAWYDDERMRLLDLRTGALDPVVGPDVRLENFVLTSDSKRAFMVDDGVFELSIPKRTISSIPVGIVPTNLNMTADDRWLLLQDSLGPVHVFDVEKRSIRTVVGGEDEI